MTTHVPLGDATWAAVLRNATGTAGFTLAVAGSPLVLWGVGSVPATVALFSTHLLLAWALLSWWIGGDAGRRGLSTRGWLLGVFLLGPPGLLAYLAVRPGHDVPLSDTDWGWVDPRPAARAGDGRLACPDCGVELDLTDRVCAHCGTDVASGADPRSGR